MFKLIVIAVLVAILAALASALVSLFRHDANPERMAKALTVRVALSLGLFALLLIGMATGLISPHGV
ncbi:MAG: twin transmembrane helix small protein [Pseudomonadota bacterium]|jgi:hypothetical protein|nr:twin transmembrane helix small protein [Pseudomonadota bacterium]